MGECPKREPPHPSMCQARLLVRFRSREKDTFNMDLALAVWSTMGDKRTSGDARCPPVFVRGSTSKEVVATLFPMVTGLGYCSGDMIPNTDSEL